MPASRHVWSAGAQIQLFAETFTEQLSYIGLLRADSVEAFEAAKQKFITGLTVRDSGSQQATFARSFRHACAVYWPSCSLQ